MLSIRKLSMILLTIPMCVNNSFAPPVFGTHNPANTSNTNNTGINTKPINSSRTGTKHTALSIPLPCEQAMQVTLSYINPNGTPDGRITNIDDCYIMFIGTTSADVDTNDVLKPTNACENLGICKANKTLWLDARPNLVEKTTDTVFMRMWKTKQAYYMFTLLPNNFRDNMSAKLYDRYTNKSTYIDLKNYNSYLFEINADTLSQSPYRFFIVYHAGSNTALNRIFVETNYVDIKVYPNPSQNGEMTIKINDMSKATYRFEIYNHTMGKVYVETIEHTSGIMVATLHPKITIPEGNYTLSIFKDNKTLNRIGIEIK
jgi:hypothetical protein